MKMVIMTNKVLILLTLVIAKISFSQDSLSQRKVKVMPVPAIGFSPETKFYLGAVALFTLDFYQNNTTRKSNAKIEFNYTWRKQVIAECDWNYFLKDEKWFTNGIVHYSLYPDYYFGIGSNTQESDQITFESKRFKSDIGLMKKVKNNWFVGPNIRYTNYYALGLTQDSIKYDELSSNQSFGIGFTITNDRRNNLLTPTSGHLIKLSNQHLVANNYYSQLAIDGRIYRSFGKHENHVFANRIYSTHVINKAPFYDLALIGGDKVTRGYFLGRFRDQNLTTFQTEYRTPFLWRISLAAFGGVSAIYTDIQNLSNNNIKINLGGGLRFLVDKNDRTSLRFDYAVGNNGQTGFYVSFGESF